MIDLLTAHCSSLNEQLQHRYPQQQPPQSDWCGSPSGRPWEPWGSPTFPGPGQGRTAAARTEAGKRKEWQRGIFFKCKELEWRDVPVTLTCRYNSKLSATRVRRAQSEEKKTSLCSWRRQESTYSTGRGRVGERVSYNTHTFLPWRHGKAVHKQHFGVVK